MFFSKIFGMLDIVIDTEKLFRKGKPVKASIHIFTCELFLKLWKRGLKFGREIGSKKMSDYSAWHLLI